MASKAVKHETGHVKHDPKTGAVAIRTVFDPAQFHNMAWLIATTGMGAQNASDADVDGWDDLFTPPPPVDPQAAIAPSAAAAAPAPATK